MNAKKFLLALGLVVAFSLPATATEFIITSSTVSSSDLYTVEVHSDDVTSEDVTEYKLRPAPYRFNTIKDALEFADDPAEYLGLELTDSESNFPNVSITLEATDSKTTSIIGGEIRMNDYSNVTDFEIAPNNIRTFYTPASATRHFIFDSSANVKLSNLIFEPNDATGGLAISLGTVELDTITFQNMNLSSGNGGAISISGGSDHSFVDCTFANNTAGNGGAVYISGGSGISFTGTNSFTGNTAGTNGGAIVSTAASVTLNLEEAVFTNNTAQLGGAIMITGGSLSVTDCSFTTNSADINGGAIYLSRGNDFTFSSSSKKNSFQSNSAANDGGAIYVAGGSSLTFSGENEFDDNTAGNNGGAIAYNAATSSAPEFAGISFNNNHAVNGGAVALLAGNVTFTDDIKFSQHNDITNGGVLYIATSGTVNIESDVTFSNNSAANGGIIYATNGTLNLNCDLTEGVSTSNGGVLYADGSNLTVNINGSIRNNTAADCGGAVYIANGIVNISGTSESSGTSTEASGDVIIEYNTANYGGAIYLAESNRARLNVNGSGLVTFSNNTATNGGGAIYAGLNSRITFRAPILFETNRVTDGNGGAMWLAASTQIPAGTVTFHENTAERVDEKDDTIGNGGALYIGGATSSSVVLNSDYNYIFTDNEAYAFGGAIYTLSSDITFDSFDITLKNTARVGGGFASSATGRITLQNGTIVSNQEAPDGGAIYASEVRVNGSTVTSNNATTGSGGAIYATSLILIENSELSGNSSQGTGQGVGGGAVYVVGDLTVTDSVLENNTANKEGAAIFANNDPGSNTTARIDNSYFNYNRILIDGNGGAVNLQNNQTTTVSNNTFTNNESQRDGGALSAQGKLLSISNCYFQGNVAARWGGAVFFSQSNSNDPEASFSMTSSMFTENKGTGGQTEGGGGAVYVATNTVSIRKCTFDSNFLMAGNNGGDYGGALYIDTTINPTGSDNDVIENCTFVNNYIDGGSWETSGGGAVAIRCEIANIRSCTMTSNKADHKGSAIYVKDGKVTISGTIAVGNTDVGAYDIWVDSTVLSGGFNRIGIYGQGGGVTDFYSVTGNTTDRTSYPHNTFMTLRSTFFSTNELAENEVSSTVPPYIGSDKYSEGKFRLLTLMLSEDVTLAEEYRATNAIPYSRRQSFPADDERGVNRRNPDIGIDIGAVFFDGTRPGTGQGENAGYSIAYIQISGVPNMIRRIGQTVSLIAKVYFTNGRTAYGGTGANDVPVVWSASPAGYLKVEPETGVFTSMRATTGETYVTITVSTLSTDLSGNPSTAIARIKISPELEFSDLNTSPESGNSDTVDIVRGLRYEFEEYNIGYGRVDKNIALIEDDKSTSVFEAIWGVTPSLVSTANLNDIQILESDTSSTLVNIVGASAGALTRDPLVFPCTFSGSELKTALGESNYSNVQMDIMSSQFYNTAITKTTAAEIFKTLRIDFQGEENLIHVLGPDSSVSVEEAIDCGALDIQPADNGNGIALKLTATLANVGVSTGSVSAASDVGGASIINGSLIVPDGTNDNKIYGTMTFPQKKITASTSEKETKTDSTENKTTEQASQTSSEAKKSSSSSGSGGGGCNSLGLGFIAAILLMNLRTKKK